MRKIIKKVKDEKTVVDTCEGLEEALYLLELHRSYSEDEFYIAYEDVALNLEDWEEEWVELCSEREKEQRESLADYRRNGGLYFDEFRDDLDAIDEQEPTDEELMSEFDADSLLDWEDQY